MHEYVVGL